MLTLFWGYASSWSSTIEEMMIDSFTSDKKESYRLLNPSEPSTSHTTPNRTYGNILTPSDPCPLIKSLTASASRYSWLDYDDNDNASDENGNVEPQCEIVQNSPNKSMIARFHARAPQMSKLYQFRSGNATPISDDLEWELERAISQDELFCIDIDPAGNRTPWHNDDVTNRNVHLDNEHHLVDELQNYFSAAQLSHISPSRKHIGHSLSIPIKKPGSSKAIVSAHSTSTNSRQSPQLEWDQDELMDTETADLLADIERIQRGFDV